MSIVFKTPSLARFWICVAVAIAVTLPAVLLRAEGWRPNALLDAALFGIAILAAGFMLSWGAEAAEAKISQGLIVAAIALVTVLPEYAVDFYYAFSAGKNPDSKYIHYAAANMTGANRLLVGLVWPAVILLHWAKTRQRFVALETVNAVEIAYLGLASVWAFSILMRDQIGPIDTIVLFTIFAFLCLAHQSLAKGRR